MIQRRHLLLGAPALGVATLASAAPDVQTRRRDNRLELWHEYAKRTRTLLARVATTRETPLLEEDLVVTGSLLFIAPATLLLIDDSPTGSTTIVDPSGSRIVHNQPRVPDPPLVARGTRPAADWLGDRLVRTFAPVAPESLIESCRAQVPKKSGGYRLDLLPPVGSAIRRVIRSYTLELDPTAGAVTRIEIDEVGSGRVTLGLRDHRQNIEAADYAALVEPLEARGIALTPAR